LKLRFQQTQSIVNACTRRAGRTYNDAPNADAQKILRNEIIDARVAALDSAFGDYERAIYQEDERQASAPIGR
jgi:hypothetical protein